MGVNVQISPLISLVSHLPDSAVAETDRLEDAFFLWKFNFSRLNA